MFDAKFWEGMLNPSIASDTKNLYSIKKYDMLLSINFVCFNHIRKTLFLKGGPKPNFINEGM